MTIHLHDLKPLHLDNQLHTLISLLEEEKSTLEQLIEACVTDKEYLLAHYHFKALRRLNYKLQTLNNMYDKLYDRKQEKGNFITYLEELLADDPSEFSNLYLDKELQNARVELAQLNEIPIDSMASGNIPLLDEVLEKLVRKKVTNVKLMLNKRDNLFLSFSYSNSMLTVSLPAVKRSQKKGILHEEQIRSFQKLGFTFNEGRSRLTLSLAGDKEDVLRNVKIVLCKIVFEVFYFKHFHNESYLLYTERSTC